MIGPLLLRARPAHALAFAGMAAPPLAALAPLALAPLLALAALAAIAAGGQRELRRLATMRPLLALLLLIGIWGAASALWSILPAHSFLEGVRFIAISAGGLVLVAVALGLDPLEREQIRRAFLWGYGVGLALLALAALAHALWQPLPTDNMIARWLTRFTRFDRGATTLALAIWPLSLALAGRRAALKIAVAFLATLAVVLALASRSAMICLLVSLFLWPIAWMLPRLTAGAIGAGLIALATMLPVFPLGIGAIARLHDAAPWISGSVIHRLAIWHFAIDRIAERPLLGWGLDASRAMPGGSDVIRDIRVPYLTQAGALWMPLHPHNAVLQWRLELGVPGAALCTLVVLWLLLRVNAGTLSLAARARLIPLIAGALEVALVSYGFWQAWWQCSLWIIAALALALAPTEPAEPREP